MKEAQLILGGFALWFIGACVFAFVLSSIVTIFFIISDYFDRD